MYWKASCQDHPEIMYWKASCRDHSYSTVCYFSSKLSKNIIKFSILYCGPSLIVIFKLHSIGQTYLIWSSTFGHICSSLALLLIKHSKTKMFNTSANTAIYKIHFIYSLFPYNLAWLHCKDWISVIFWTQEGLCGTRFGTLLLSLLSRNV